MNFEMLEPSEAQLNLVAKSYALRQRYWPDYTWGIQTTHLKAISAKECFFSSRGIEVEELKRRLSDLFNKINASFYHLEMLKHNENTIIELSREMALNNQADTPPNVLGVIGSPYEPIDYEYESFLVTLKSALDILSIILAEAYSLNTDNLGGFVDLVNHKKKISDDLKVIKEFITSAESQSVINEFLNKGSQRSRRNHAVHEGSLPTGTINIQYSANNPNVNVVKTRSMELNGDSIDFTQEKELEEYCALLFYGSCDYIVGLLNTLLDENFVTGSKMSVYLSRVDSMSETSRG
jgi:hypothetical protein